MNHPAHSPDLVRAISGFFPTLKSELHGRKFDDADDLPTVVSKTVLKIPQEHFRSCFDKWICRQERWYQIKENISKRCNI